MQLKKENMGKSRSIDYFVRNKLKKEDEIVDTELWAKEWLNQYVDENQKTSTKELYKTYHSIASSVQFWEEKLKIKSVGEQPRKSKQQLVGSTFKAKAKELLEKNRYKTLIEFDQLKPEEYKMIVDWFEKEKELPEYMRGIVKYRPTALEIAEKIQGESMETKLSRIQNYIFLLFIGLFFMILVIINL